MKELMCKLLVEGKRVFRLAARETGGKREEER
jgi:hypothetical protein